MFSKTYEVNLPDDYLHILNCIVEYDVKTSYKCNTSGTKAQFGAKRATADMTPQLFNNFYMKPSYKNPYYYINNININNTYPTSENLIDILNIDIVPTTSV